MFFTPVITLLASPLPQHDDGNLTFLLQLHLSPYYSHLHPWSSLQISLPELPVSPVRCDPASSSNPPTPFHPLESPSIPALNLHRNSFLAIPLVAGVHESLPCSGRAVSNPVRHGWLFSQPSKRLRPFRRADTCRFCAPRFDSRSLLVWEF